MSNKPIKRTKLEMAKSPQGIEGPGFLLQNWKMLLA